MAEDKKFVLGIDLEGINDDLVFSGVNLKKDRVTEIGAVLWDTELNQPVQILSELIDEPGRLKITKEVEELTGITDEMLNEWGQDKEMIKLTLRKLSFLMEKADFIMAHNGTNYDEPMLREMFKRYDLKMPNTHWIDSSTDIEFPEKIRNRSMANLEHAHGFVNPFPHRAVTDVLSMLKIASLYEWQRIFKLAVSEKVTIIAELTAPDWKNKSAVESFNKVKNKVARSGFRWNPSKKIWSKEIQQVLIDEGKVNYEFSWHQK